MSRVPNERTTLLPTNHRDNHRDGYNDEDLKPSKRDPMEISAVRRGGILAGLWLGTFLGVCINIFNPYVLTIVLISRP